MARFERRLEHRFMRFADGLKALEQAVAEVVREMPFVAAAFQRAADAMHDKLLKGMRI